MKRKQGLWLVVVLLAALSSGCYTTRPVKISELPKLNGASATYRGSYVAGYQHRIHVSEVSVAYVRRPDGSLMRVVGSFNLILKLQNGDVVKTHSPVRTRFDRRVLVVRGSNRPATGFPLDDIRYAGIQQMDQGRTFLLITGITMGVLLAASIPVIAMVMP